MVQVVLCSVSVICAGQRHAGFWKRAGWNRGELMLDSRSWLPGGRSLQTTRQITQWVAAPGARVNNNIIWIKLNSYNPRLSPHPGIVRPRLWHTYSSQPRATLLSPPLPAGFIHEISSSPACHTLQLFHLRNQGPSSAATRLLSEPKPTASTCPKCSGNIKYGAPLLL